MTTYPFDLLDQGNAQNGHELLLQRTQHHRRNLEDDADYFEPSEALKTAIHTALAIGEPLLLTGDAGTGKTQTAYYIANLLGLKKVLHFQVKSNSVAQDILYRFDHVKYYRDAGSTTGTDTQTLKKQCISEGVLWKALTDHNKTRVVLIDEIDKAPRDFPNDLLHELDQMEFKVAELDDQEVGDEQSHRPIIIITSNSERRLPDAFLRRCVFHYIDFNEALLRKAVKAHHHEFKDSLQEDFINLAIERFMLLQNKQLRKNPATGEFLAWLRVMAMIARTDVNKLQAALQKSEDDLSELPYLGVLLKNREDIELLGRSPY